VTRRPGTGEEKKMKLRWIPLLAAVTTVVSVTAASDGQASGATAITSCGQTVTTNVYLTGDLDCGSLDGIVVGASGITIDLKGFTLRGDGSVHYGIYDPGGYDHVSVKNGVLRNFAFGLDAYNGADEISVSGVVASGNGGGIGISGASASVKSSTASGNSGIGIVIDGPSATVQSSIVSGNGFHGIRLSGPSASVKSTSVSGSGASGIYVSGAAPSVVSSTVSSNVAFGILVEGAAARIQSSTVVGNGSGVVVSGDAAVINRNQADGNGFADGVSDGGGLGISVEPGYTIAPAGKNVARGNDDPGECVPLALC
jgi:hypothetical protein